jgi:hypothetical protein
LDIGNEEQIGYPASKLTDILRDHLEKHKEILKKFQYRIFSTGTLEIYRRTQLKLQIERSHINYFVNE